VPGDRLKLRGSLLRVPKNPRLQNKKSLWTSVENSTETEDEKELHFHRSEGAKEIARWGLHSVRESVLSTRKTEESLNGDHHRLPTKRRATQNWTHDAPQWGRKAVQKATSIRGRKNKLLQSEKESLEKRQGL